MNGKPFPRSRILTLTTLALLVVVALVAASARPTKALTVAAASISPGAPIKHVVIIYQENHSFDNALGKLCVTNDTSHTRAHCDGTTVGKLPGGALYPLTHMPDIVPPTAHNSRAQATAIDGGAMDGWAKLGNCKTSPYACLAQYNPADIPNLSALAQQFTIADHTFEMDAIPSWGAHLELVAQTLDHFIGDNPHTGATGRTGPSGGCDSGDDATWRATPTSPIQQVPSCVPNKTGAGPYRASPVAYVPTIMDRLDAAGLSWKLYAKATNIWGICPTFFECWGSSQRQKMVSVGSILTDAAGTLPAFSIVLPTGPTGKTSQHNGSSMKLGDNWIGQMVNAIEHGPNWNSTAIFITYDDCGCFYDHLAPPAGLGIRVPMVIVSPFAKPGFTDSGTASFASLLAFTEHLFGLAALTTTDAGAYDYANSFNFAQAPLAPVPMTQTPLSFQSQHWLATHPTSDNDDST